MLETRREGRKRGGRGEKAPEDGGRLTRVPGTEGRKGEEERLVDGLTQPRERGEVEREEEGGGVMEASQLAPLFPGSVDSPPQGGLRL